MAVRGGTPVYFVARQILLVRGDVPVMAERVGDAADAIAIELVGHRACELGPRGDRLADDGIDILDIEMDADRRAADGRGAECADLWMLVRQHHARIANADLGVTDLAARVLHPLALDRTESPHVEFERPGTARDDQVGRDRVIAVGNGFGHASLLCLAHSGADETTRIVGFLPGSPSGGTSFHCGTWFMCSVRRER